MAKAAGRHLPHYLANTRSGQYLQALAGVVGIPTTVLLESIQGGRADLQGTWVHPRLAVDIARWISPEFAVWMDGWILEELETSSREAAAPAVPFTREELSSLMGLICTKVSKAADLAGGRAGYPWYGPSLREAQELMQEIADWAGLAERILPLIRPSVPGELGGRANLTNKK